MSKGEGISHHISLKDIDCTRNYFDEEIKPIIMSLRDLSYEHLVVEDVSDNIDFIQTIFEDGSLHRIEVKTCDNRFMSSNGYTKEQAVEVFRQACIEKKRFEELNDCGNVWHEWRDFQKEELCKMIVADFEDKELTLDEEAMYLEALNYLVHVWRSKRALEMLIDYYRKIGDEELFKLYTNSLKDQL